MNELEPREFHRAASIVKQAPFNVLMAEAVLDGEVPGRVFTDRLDRPRSCYIRHRYGMSFVVGSSPDASWRGELETLFTGSGEAGRSTEMLQVFPPAWSGELMSPLVSAGEVWEWGRVNFLFKGAGAGGGRKEPEHPGIVRIDRGILDGFTGTVVPGRFWNSEEQFLRKGVGFCLLDPESGAPASIAFSSCLRPPFLEIGVETAEAFRGKGYAFEVSRKMVRFCLENGFVPVWSCKKENTGSFRLALKLGFEEHFTLPYYEVTVPKDDRTAR